MLVYAADGPNAADWLEAWSTLGAAIFSAAAILIAFMVWRHDQRLRREDKLDAEAAQARLVLVSVTAAIGSPDDGWQGVHVLISNNSQTMISAVRVLAMPGLPIGFTAEVTMSPIPGNITDGKEVLFQEKHRWPFRGAEPRPEQVAKRTSTLLLFTDGAGLRWTRENDGEPKRRHVGTRAESSLSWLIADYMRLIPFLTIVRRLPLRLRTSLAHWLETRLRRRYFKQAAGPGRD
ncbi:hypothetical protein [Paractinoplanes toevensis]|nr:hypothetical protein [Actinoplanes toevensis]